MFLAPLKILSAQVVQQLMKHSETDFQCKVAILMEERCTRWTTYKTLSTWFDLWEQQLASWKFGHYNEDGSFIIPDHQLAWIINFDETALPLDGTDGRCGD